jgi:mannose-6-phosphate isomerase-like protein (cupin superfamily)
MKFVIAHEDGRGRISLLTELQHFHEVSIFETKKGRSRGGCIHMFSDEYCCVIEGEVEYHMGSISKKLKAGDMILVPRATPHYFVSITDSVLMEWGPSPEEKKDKHPATRKIVDKINSSFYE